MTDHTDSPPEPRAMFATDRSSSFVRKLISNIKSDLIEITEDKLENILLKHLSKLAARRSWITPLTLAVTLGLTITTATFSTTFGLDAAVWQAVFLILACGSFIWLILAVIDLARSWHETSLSSLMDHIKDAKKNPT